LKSQIVISSWGDDGQPYAFTEQGVAMLQRLCVASAVHVNIEIMRAFVRMRQILAANADLSRKLDGWREERPSVQNRLRRHPRTHDAA
jgi:hypothetical protein